MLKENDGDGCDFEGDPNEKKTITTYTSYEDKHIVIDEGQVTIMIAETEFTVIGENDVVRRNRY